MNQPNIKGTGNNLKFWTDEDNFYLMCNQCRDNKCIGLSKMWKLSNIKDLNSLITILQKFDNELLKGALTIDLSENAFIKVTPIEEN